MNSIKVLAGLLVFALINIPILFDMNRYFFRNQKRYIKLLFAVGHFILAGMTQNIWGAVCVIILIAFVYSKNKHDREDDLRREINPWRFKLTDILSAAGLTVPFYFATHVISIAYILLLERMLRVNLRPQDVITEFSSSRELYRTLLFIMIVIIAPLLEEYIFRSFVYDRVFLSKMPRFFAILLSSILFSLLHTNAASFFAIFALGVFCCILYEHKGFYGAVTAHVAFNLITTIRILTGT